MSGITIVNPSSVRSRDLNAVELEKLDRLPKVYLQFIISNTVYVLVLADSQINFRL